MLDPMAGSGTSLVVARGEGHYAVGFDTDPLAVLMSRVWCADINTRELLDCGNAVLASAKRRYRRIKQGTAYPRGADEETRAFVRRWFDVINRRQLRAVADAVGGLRRPGLREVMWCAFSRLIIAKSQGASRALDLSHGRPHLSEDKAPVRPFKHLERWVRRLARDAPFQGEAAGGVPATVLQADARRLPLPDGSVDVAITSPPYVNAIDYLRCNKFSLVWMGHSVSSLRSIRGSNIGTEAAGGFTGTEPWVREALEAMTNPAALPRRVRSMLARYVTDLRQVLAELQRVLRPEARCVLVVGDCTMRGVFVRNSNALEYLARHLGLRVVERTSRELPEDRRYLPPPGAAASGAQLARRLREEVVLTLQKTKAPGRRRPHGRAAALKPRKARKAGRGGVPGRLSSGTCLESFLKLP